MTDRSRVASGSPFEKAIGFTRAVRVGERVVVSGTAPVMPDGADPLPGAYGQVRRCLDVIVAALHEAGAEAKDVVRTRIYLMRREDWEDIGRAHAEVFGEHPPASTMVVVAGLLDPRWLVEIEAEAIIG